MHQHSFEGASEPLSVRPTDVLVAYVYLDPAHPPREVMLQWNDGSREHRAYWGDDVIDWGTNDSPSRRFMGELPPTGRWVRLEVPAGSVGLGSRPVHGMAFTLFDGRATWDHAGRAGAAHASPEEDEVWVEDTLPEGATAGGNEPWQWVEENPLSFAVPGRLLAGGAGAAEDGTFRVAIDEERVARMSPERPPHLYFRVTYGSEVLASTENSLVWRPGDAPDGLEIAVTLPEPAPQPLVQTLTGRLLEPGSRTPVGGLVVRAVLPAAPGNERELGAAISDAQGAFLLRISFPAGTRPGDALGMLIHVSPPDGEPLHRMDVRVWAGQEQTFDILVELPGARGTAAMPLPELAVGVGLDLDPALAGFLERRGIRDLAGIRAAGGLRGLEGLPVPPDDPLVHRLDAHAQLSVLPTAAALNARLIEAGFTNLAEIADVSPRRFVEVMAVPAGGVQRAAIIHAAAGAQMQVLNNVLTGLRVGGDGGALQTTVALRSLLSPECACDDCRSATSGLAYLADLLDYAVRHVRNGGAPITLAFLEGRFHQPFRRLPASCAAAEEHLCQVRIAIEVLRGYLPESQRSYAPPGYLRAVYFMLLERHGTSFDELRQARGLDRDARRAILRRLQLSANAGPANGDLLDVLFRDPAQVTEAWLHEVFGLRDTTLDPLAPDPPVVLERERRRYLREQWKAEDWPAQAAPGARPIIDPDVVSLGDIRHISKANPVFRLLVQRQNWIESVMSAMDQARTDPNGGLDKLLRSGELGLGSERVKSDGPSVTDIRTLRERRQGGGDINADLTKFRLTPDAFDYLSAVVEWDANGTAVLQEEWLNMYAILMQRLKERDQYTLWRQEEEQQQINLSFLSVNWKGIELSPDHFEVRTAGDAPPWRPKPWRSSWEARLAWEDTLKARTQQDQAVRDHVAEAIDATEEALLGKLRDGLLGMAALLDPAAPKQPAYFTDHLQIDVEMAACQQTTRLAQAIETVQGLLFGARHGLLRDASLTLDAIAFDDAWQWLGSYDAWRAAMLVFLYPETALRPALRKPQSPVFAALVKRMRAAGRIAPDDADAVAADYSRYFADVVSMGEAGLYDSPRSLDPALTAAPGDEPARYVLAVAKAGASGRHYFSQYRLRVKPSLFPGLSPVYYDAQVERFWTAIAPSPQNGGGVPRQEEESILPRESEIVGMIPYQPTSGAQLLGLYARTRMNGEERVSFTRYDGTAWSQAATMPAMPALVRAAQADAGAVAPDPEAAVNGVGAAALQGDEHLVAADIDGDGRQEILAIAAAPDSEGRRRVSVLRESSGGLATWWTGNLPEGWRLPDPTRPVVLRTITVFPRLVDRLLAVNDNGPFIGILGWQPETGLTVVWSSSSVGAWPVRLSNSVPERCEDRPWTRVDAPTAFVAANIDGFGVRVLAFEHHESGRTISCVKTSVTVLNWGNDALTFVSTQDLDSDVNADWTTHPGKLLDQFDIQWQRFVPVRRQSGTGGFSSQHDDILLLAARRELSSLASSSYVTGTYLLLLRWDMQRMVFRTGSSGATSNPSELQRNVNFYEGSVPGAAGQNAWIFDPLPVNLANPNKPADAALLDDELYVIRRRGAADRPEILVRSAARNAVGVLHYQQNGGLLTVWQATGTIPGPSNAGLDWQLKAGDRFLVADLDGDGSDEILIAGQDGLHLGLAAIGDDGSLAMRWMAQRNVASPDLGAGQAWRLSPAATTRFATADLDGDGLAEVAVLTADQRLGLLRGIPQPKSEVPGLLPPLQPRGVTALRISNQYAPQEAATRRAQVQAAYAANAGSAARLVYLDEAYYFLPVEVGLRLREAGYHAEALDWLRTVYDYAKPAGQRKVPSLLIWEEGLEAGLKRSASWMADTLNPHRIAATRRLSYTRFTLLTIIQCLLEFADAEFTRNTHTSRAQARELYLTALELLSGPEFQDQQRRCQDVVETLTIQVGEDEEPFILRRLQSELRKISRPEALADAVSRAQAILNREEDLSERFASAWERITTAVTAQPEPRSLEAALTDHRATLAQVTTGLLADAAVVREVEQVGRAVAGGRLPATGSRPAPGPESPLPPAPGNDLATEPGSGGVSKLEHEIIQAPRFGFCIAANPALEIARNWAENNLFKLRNCRDIAGMQQSDDGRPTQYRFEVLIERAKELARLAGQIEGAMLAALERRDQEYYTLLLAQQELQVAGAVVQVQGLRLAAADRDVILATLQQGRAQTQAAELTKWIDGGLNKFEQEVVNTYKTIAKMEIEDLTFDTIKSLVAGVVTAASGAYAGTTSGSGAIFDVLTGGMSSILAYQRKVSYIHIRTQGQVAAINASHERKVDEWNLARTLAEQDSLIAGTQILAAQDGVAISRQEHAIAGMRSDHAAAVVNFLSRKFTSYDLYDWMSGVLERVYRFFLQQATVMGQAAAHQLAFERQESLTRFIQPDYWLPPATDRTGGAAGQDRRGLTGSARLTQDLYQLDQYAFQTNRQKLQLVKVISLAELDPYAFALFQQSGVLRLNTPMELFDRDFPGHYLRLIRQVRVSVIALIPPMHGIRAVLSSNGISRVVVPDGGGYRTVVVHRGPESVALSAPINATGRFDLEMQGGMPYPFEWMGVDTTWELQLPKASNPFDYRTLADVLLTMEYTALESADYRREVIQRLGDRPLVAERPFSFRHELADAWYDLNNPDPTKLSVTVRWETRREDFPPNLDDLKIERVVLSFSYASGRSFAMRVEDLTFTPEGANSIVGGEGESDTQGTISSRADGGADGWRTFKEQSTTAVGRWELTLTNTPNMRDRFKNEEIENLLFIVTYSGRTPVWPA